MSRYVSVLGLEAPPRACRPAEKLMPMTQRPHLNCYNFCLECLGPFGFMSVTTLTFLRLWPPSLVKSRTTMSYLASQILREIKTAPWR